MTTAERLAMFEAKWDELMDELGRLRAVVDAVEKLCDSADMRSFDGTSGCVPTDDFRAALGRGTP